MTKALISQYQMSIQEAGIWTPQEISIIWDFYVTKSVAASASQRRGPADYGLAEIPFEGLLDHEKIAASNSEMLMADTINGVLKEHGFEYKTKKDGQEVELAIDIDTPRLVCVQPYSITDRNKPAAKGGGKGRTLLTHMRNSLAHGCTYFFDNGNLLFEDRAGGSSGKTTAMVLLPQSALLDWVKIIDIRAHYYFPDVDRGPYLQYVKQKPGKSNNEGPQ